MTTNLNRDEIIQECRTIRDEAEAIAKENMNLSDDVHERADHAMRFREWADRAHSLARIIGKPYRQCRIRLGVNSNDEMVAHIITVQDELDPELTQLLNDCGIMRVEWFTENRKPLGHAVKRGQTWENDIPHSSLYEALTAAL